MKNLIVSFVVSIFLLGCCSNTASDSVVNDVNDSTDIEIRSSSVQLNNAFYWAKKKARSYVQTNKSGKVNQSEFSSGGGNVKYIPSYWAGYPFRTAFYSRDYCHQMVGAHLLGLYEENYQMLRAFAKSSTLARKWYPLWAINFDGSIYKVDYKSDDNFVREVPAVFELVEKAYRQYLWTNDSRLLNDPVLWSYYQRSVSDFISLHDANNNGIAEGSGTSDIFKGIATYNEGMDKYPCLEAGDGIASQYQALLSYSKLVNAKGNNNEAKIWYDKAESIKSYFENIWSKTTTNNLYVRGYDVQGNPHWDFARETSWFMPMKHITDAGLRNKDFLNYISTSLNSAQKIPSNIESITYLPDVFFPYNHVEEGWYWTCYILNSLNKLHAVSMGGTDGDYPEISYTLISNVVENLLGFQPNAPKNEFSTIPRLPLELAYLEVKNIPIGNNLVSVKHVGNKMTLITNVSGGDIKCNIQFYGSYTLIDVDGSKQKAIPGKLNGEITSSVSVLIPPTKSIIAKVL